MEIGTLLFDPAVVAIHCRGSSCARIAVAPVRGGTPIRSCAHDEAQPRAIERKSIAHRRTRPHRQTNRCRFRFRPSPLNPLHIQPA